MADQRGQVIGSKTYTWNVRNQLTGLSGGASASFQYDGLGRRRAKTISSTTTGFLYDGLNAVQELSGGSTSANILSGLGVDEWFKRTDATTTRHFLADPLGSTVALADGSGAIQTEYTYGAFGATTTSGSSTTNRSGFTGREDDGTGLNYYRARYQHSTLQRFISEDPIDLGANRYAYVGNQPLTWVDPLGLQQQEPPGGPPFPPTPGGPSGNDGWKKGPDGKYTPRTRVPSPKGGQPDATWDTEDGWWRKNDGKGGKTEHYWPDGGPAPDRHPKYGPSPQPPSPEVLPPSPWWWLWRLPFPFPFIINPCLFDPFLAGCNPMLPGRSCGI